MAESGTSLQRQDTASSSGSGIDGVPFKLHPSLAKPADSAALVSAFSFPSLDEGGTGVFGQGFPELREVDEVRLETDFGYAFATEQQVLTTQLSNA